MPGWARGRGAGPPLHLATRPHTRPTRTAHLLGPRRPPFAGCAVRVPPPTPQSSTRLRARGAHNLGGACVALSSCSGTGHALYNPSAPVREQHSGWQRAGLQATDQSQPQHSNRRETRYLWTHGGPKAGRESWCSAPGALAAITSDALSSAALLRTTGHPHCGSSKSNARLKKQAPGCHSSLKQALHLGVCSVVQPRPQCDC